MNPDTLDQQVKNVLDAAQHGEGTVLREQLLGIDLVADNEALLRLKNAEVQLRFGSFFADKQKVLDTVYTNRPSSTDAATAEAYAEIITTYLTDFDDDLDTFNQSLKDVSVLETLASKADNTGVQQLVVQALTQDNTHDHAWFLSRAHMTRDGVNESLWSIVTASDGDAKLLLPVLEQAFRLANKELSMAVNALIPQGNTPEAQS